MKLSHLLGTRLREAPRDAQAASHALLQRAGYVRQNAAGVFSYLPLMTRVMARIMAIIRDEMNALGGQELLFPLVNSREMWERTGRYASVGGELVRFSDREQRGYVLAMTHEEAAAAIAQTELATYRQLPLMVYQFQLKFRDEPRPRAGLIRAREFTMKDAYSYHLSREDMSAFYATMHDAYARIFGRVGLRAVSSVESDVGAMGGSLAHEFVLEAESGEDTIVLCPACSYRANREIARARTREYREPALPLEMVPTPGKKTIEDVAGFLGVPLRSTGKAVFYATAEGDLAFVLIRGDREVNPIKLARVLATSGVTFADEREVARIGAVAGYASPMGIGEQRGLRLVIDSTVPAAANLVVGANREGFHYRGFNFERDLNRGEIADVLAVEEGDGCPECGASLRVARGIEIGNIFQLGDHYSAACGVQVLGPNGTMKIPLMCSYGIGIGRLAAAIVEESHDEHGIIWPAAVAPFLIHLIVLDSARAPAGAPRAIADRLYAEMLRRGVDVLYDDRGDSPGIKFADADLIGVPYQVIVSERTLQKKTVEVKVRRTLERLQVPMGGDPAEATLRAVADAKGSEEK